MFMVFVVAGLLTLALAGLAVSTILLKTHTHWQYHEGRCGATAVKPGFLIELNSTDLLIPAATAGKLKERAVAIEDSLRGKSVNDAYATGDLIRYLFMAPGTECYLILKAGQNAAEGADLTSNGDGTVKVANGTTDLNIAICKEALDLTAGGALDTFVKVRFK